GAGDCCKGHALSLVVPGPGPGAVPVISRAAADDPGPGQATAGGRSGGSIGEPITIIELPTTLSPSASPSTSASSSASPSASPSGSPSARPATGASPTSRSAPTTPPTRTQPAPSRAPQSRPPTSTAPAPSDTTTAPRGDLAAQVIALVNQERAAAGCPAVTAQPQLTEAARRHSEDQAARGTLSHTGSDGSTPWERAERLGYQGAIGENVAAGYRTAEAVMAGWMDSPGHRANILNCQARAIGVGVAAAADGTLYWTQMFGRTV
ncbi:MAG: hypothetical protein DIU79_08820, partial [Actinobacteria bacterium]